MRKGFSLINFLALNPLYLYRHSEADVTGCLRSYRKSILHLRISILGRLRDLQYTFSVIYGTLSIASGTETNLCPKKRNVCPIFHEVFDCLFPGLKKRSVNIYGRINNLQTRFPTIPLENDRKRLLSARIWDFKFVLGVRSQKTRGGNCEYRNSYPEMKKSNPDLDIYNPDIR